LKRLLIAEDNEESRYLLETLLRSGAFEVVAVENGAAALEAAADDLPDLLITDILMPVMDGFSLCREWKADNRLKKVPVIVYTATYTDPKDEELALKLGADRFVVKPAEPDDLLKVVRAVLAERDMGEELAAREPVAEEEVLYKLYNETLVRRLEAKVLQLEEANRTAAEAVENYHSLLEVANDAIITADPKTGEVLDCNRATERLLGRPRDTIIGKHQRHLHPEGKAKRYEHLFLRHVELGRTVTSGDVEVLHNDGRAIPVEISAGVSIMGGRRVIVGIFRNLSRRIEAEEALRESEAQYTGLFKNAPIGMYRTTLDGRILMSNLAMVEMLGFESSEELAKRHLDSSGFATDQSRERFKEIITRDGHVRGLEYEILKKDGTPILIRENARLVRALDGSVMYYEGSMEDITDRRRVEDERARLAQAIDQAGEIVMITDIDARIVYVNPAFEQGTGYDLEEVIGENPRFLKSGHHDEAFYHRMWQTLARGESWSGSFVNKHKDGSLIEEQTVISPVRDEMGMIVNYVAVKRDVTRQKQVEAELLHAQRMESVGRLAGGVAHDFNNLLQVILSHCELMKLSFENENDPCRNELFGIEAAANRASSLTGQLLAFSRKQVLKPVVLNIGDQVESLWKMVGRLIGEDITLSAMVSEDPVYIYADPGQIEQVILNLAVNARDAMPDGGGLSIEIGTTVIEDSDFKPQLDLSPGPFVVITVGDTGFGMDAETRAHIFEPFFTTKESGEGTGLGLSTVFGIVQQSGGAIHVYSEPGHGTVFNIYLPQVERVEDDAQPHAVSKIPGGDETILLLEDDLQVRAIAKRLLAVAGYRVLETGDPHEAVRLAEDHPGEIHLLFTDVVLPDQSGPAIAKKVASIRGDCRVLYMSGYVGDSIGKHGVLDSEVDFLQKPFTARDLLVKVREVLDRQH